jgi:hypothetical protein
MFDPGRLLTAALRRLQSDRLGSTSPNLPEFRALIRLASEGWPDSVR